MKTSITDPIAPIHRSWKTSVARLAVLLALGLAVSTIALNYLVPRLVEGPRRAADCVDRHFQHQRLQADARTLIAAVRYFLEAEPQYQTGSGPSPRALATMPGNAVSGSGRAIATNAVTPSPGRADARPGTPDQV